MMYSHGIPALLVFLLLFVIAARRLAAVSTPAKWLRVIPVIALVVMPFYGYTDMNLSVMFFGIGWRWRRSTARSTVAPTPNL
ncbi:hypothetical protein [Couchioplanes caeruleus]|uniref:Uncharacterized protein n=2 Tax=Couchioplanes caeruleus TaxID=56438 RepID=A0A1K0GKW7_9ACTN|nr:hypothetical protein [Couchioplanes caeruleus]OJF09835.1 hypothetical protein BG844_35325 [Couchioplanes caeruleus subsp. caeruleus]ROP29714.1 hypothetical protein EDD30_2526 [Couchioplanes caeruleus]